jgi:hypothetical protein
MHCPFAAGRRFSPETEKTGPGCGPSGSGIPSGVSVKRKAGRLEEEARGKGFRADADPTFLQDVQRNPSLRAKEPRKGVRAKFASFSARWEPGGVRSNGNLKEAGREVRFEAWLSGTGRSSLRKEPGRVLSKFASMERPGNLDEASASEGNSKGNRPGPQGLGRNPDPGSARPSPASAVTADSGGWQRCQPPFAFGASRRLASRATLDR